MSTVALSTAVHAPAPPPNHVPPAGRIRDRAAVDAPDIPDDQVCDADLALVHLAALAADVAGFSSFAILRLDGRLLPRTGPVADDVRRLPIPTDRTVLVVPDAAADPRTASLEPVTSGRVGSLVAVPAVGIDGHVVGTLVLHDPLPRTSTCAAIARLGRFAALIGTGLDVAQSYEQLDADRQRWELAVEAGGVGSFDWDLVSNRLDWDERLMELFGYGDGGDFVAHIDSFTVRLHPEDVAPTEARIAEAIAVSGRYRAEYRVVWPDGTVRWVAARGTVTRDLADRPARMRGVAFDVTEAHQARSMVQRTRDRLSLLAAVSAALADRRDPEDAMAQLAPVIAPRLADACIVSFVGEDGRLRDVGSHHPDPVKAATLAAYAKDRLQALPPHAWVKRAAATGRIIVIPYPAWENIAPLAAGHPAAGHITALAPAFGLCVPVRIRDEVLGVLTLFNDLETGPFGPTDQQVAAEVAARAAVAIDAARSFHRQRRMAEEMQRSLLVAPPVVDPFQVAVRYAPSEDDVQVGGDWYDAFPLADGTLAVTVGDVMGHDSIAAARMAQLRSNLRGIFFATTPEPGAGLATLDAALARFDLRTSATAVAARLWAEPDGAATVAWSIAGHPPPIVVGPDGARVLGAPVDPPLGVVRAGVGRRTSRFRLNPGETMLCYTDGLVERRDEDIDRGILRLRDLAAAAGPDPEQLVDAVLALRSPRGADDVALLAVRCRPAAG